MLVADIRRTVAAHYGLTDADMVGQCRERRVARPRQVAMYLARELTCQSFPIIGRSFHRDHTTVIHGCGTIADLRRYDSRMAADIFAILGRLPA